MYDFIDKHTNAFIQMHGIPYLLAEYCDRDNIRQLDRSMIYTAVDIDTTEAMRAVVDISIDDIGKRASDGRPNVISNHKMQEDVVRAVHHIFKHAEKSLPVIRRGLVVRVNYRIENGRTGETIRSVYEDIRVPERQYFVDTDPKDIDMPAIVTNFATTQVSTINQFTHGTDPMTLRITSVQLCYEVMKVKNLEPRGRIDRPYQRMEDLGVRPYEERYGIYEYHKEKQHVQYLGEPIVECPHHVYPYDWFGFNHLYHFADHGRDIILHMEDIYNHHAETTLIECGRLMINRAFLINPGERIIFKLCIWKNDLAMFNDTTPIARAMDPCFGGHEEPFEPIQPFCPEKPSGDPYMPPVSRRVSPKDAIDEIQDVQIDHLNDKMDVLIRAIMDKNYPRPCPPPCPPHPPCPPCPPCPPVPPPPPGPKDKIKLILEIMHKMQHEIRDLQEEEEREPEIEPISEQQIEDILNNIPDEEIDDLYNTIMNMADEN